MSKNKKLSDILSLIEKHAEELDEISAHLRYCIINNLRDADIIDKPKLIKQLESINDRIKGLIR